MDLRALLPVLAAEGLTAQTRRLAAAGCNFTIRTEGEAREILAACPALESAGVAVDGVGRNAAAAARALPLGAGSSVTVRLRAFRIPSRATVFCVNELTEALSQPRSLCVDVFRLRFEFNDDDGGIETLVASLEEEQRLNGGSVDMEAEASAVQAAAAALSAALVDSQRGPLAIEFSGTVNYSFPLSVNLLNQLTGDSRLRRLVFEGGSLRRDDEILEALAGALAQGRSRLEDIEIRGEHGRRANTTYTQIADEGCALSTRRLDRV